MSYTMRVMREADLEPARWVIYLAYSRILGELYGPHAAASYELRSPAFMQTYLAREPLGCLVAESPQGEVAGVNFCFVWGTTGWFGSLAVHPDHQGRGVGQALTQAAVDYLRDQGCQRLGLETWPESELVRHLYGKFGFTPAETTEKLGRPMRPRRLPGGPWVARWLSQVDAAGAPRLIHAARAVATAIDPGLDYTKEIQTWTEAAQGDLVVVWHAEPTRRVRPAAFALGLMVRPSGIPHEHVDVRLLCVSPRLGYDQAAALDVLLIALERYALARGRRGMTVDVNLRYARAREFLLERGFHPVSQLLCMEMMMAGASMPLDEENAINCARWAG